VDVYRRGDLGQVARALRVLDALRGFRHGRALSELAAEVGVSERTVRRDLAELVDAGFEIDLSPIDRRAAARLIERSYSNVPITRRERFTLLAVRSVFDVLRGTPLHDDITSVLTKLEQRMSPEEREEHATFGDRFAYIPDGGTKAYDGKDDIIDALQTGILSRKVVRYAYTDSRNRTQRGFLAPFCLLLYRHGLYVIGRRLKSPDQGKTPIDATSSSLGVFAVERFTEAAHLRASSFIVDPGFRIADALHGAFGIHIADPGRAQQVVIEFSKAKAHLVAARLWHPTQTIESLADGRVRLTFSCANLAPVVSWALEWGPHARVVAPTELVDAVRLELRHALASYDQEAASATHSNATQGRAESGDLAVADGVERQHARSARDQWGGTRDLLARSLVQDPSAERPR
jgi:predicted DNA-binding transcriptional regulator YafY